MVTPISIGWSLTGFFFRSASGSWEMICPSGASLYSLPRSTMEKMPFTSSISSASSMVLPSTEGTVYSGTSVSGKLSIMAL